MGRYQDNDAVVAALGELRDLLDTHVARWETFDRATVGTAQGIANAIRKLAFTPSPLPSDAEGERRGWLPIETAPRDGRAIMIGFLGIPKEHPLNNGPRLAWYKRDEDDHGWDWTDGHNLYFRPNVWFDPGTVPPLPPPPEPSGEQPAIQDEGGAA